MNSVHSEPSSRVTGTIPQTRAHGMRRPRRRVKLPELGLVGITQTILGRGPEFGEPTGNAMQAALATVFGLPLTAVPHFAGMELDDGWWDVLNTWLDERYGLALISCTPGEWEMPRILHLSQGLRADETPHVVVGFGGQLLHDPHPSGAGLSTVLAHELFVAIRPGGLTAGSDATTKSAPLAMVWQAQPMPETALRTTLAAAGVKRCTRCGVVKPLAEFSRVPGRPRRLSWCRPCSNRSSKESMQRARLKVLAHYSGGTMRCACCGQNQLAFLALDHVNGDGAAHRKAIGSGDTFYRWLIKSGFPPGLQVLCHCCNVSKSVYGSCPHTRKRAASDSPSDSGPA